MSEIYALSDDFFTPEDVIVKFIHEILDNGVKFVQFRSKKKEKNEKIISELIRLCDDYHAYLIINDDALLARKLGAHGVHIGKDDGSIIKAREILGENKIIGVSCYDDLTLALNAQQNGASYAAFGAVFKSPTKKDAKICNHDVLKKAAEILKIPTCVIGGINAGNLRQILKFHPNFVAIVSALYHPRSITENLKNLQRIINEYN